jgi:hypothetical protein
MSTINNHNNNSNNKSLAFLQLLPYETKNELVIFSSITLMTHAKWLIVLYIRFLLLPRKEKRVLYSFAFFFFFFFIIMAVLTIPIRFFYRTRRNMRRNKKKKKTYDALKSNTEGTAMVHG